MDKTYRSSVEAIRDITDGATVMFGGFGDAGFPENLCRALTEVGARDLIIISNNCGTGDHGLAALLRAGQVRKMIASFPSAKSAYVFRELYQEGKVELELVPQGTLVERIRAAGAGIGGFYVRVAVGTELAAGKETRVIDGVEYILERALPADFAFVKAHRGDPWGNLIFRRTARNFNPVMAMAARITVAEVEEMAPLGQLDPEAVVTPSIFVHRIVKGERYEVTPAIS